MAINQKFVYPGCAGEQIASRAAGEAADVRQIRACATALSVVGVLQAFGLVTREAYEDMCHSEDPQEILLVAEVIYSALSEEAREAHILTVEEAKHGMLPPLTKEIQ